MTVSVRDRVLQIIAEQVVLDVSDIGEEATLEDLGVDSLGLVEAVFALEEEFDIEIPFNANQPDQSRFDISTVRGIVRAVETLVAARTV